MQEQAREYFREVGNVAKELVSEAMEIHGDVEEAKEAIQDSLLHEWIDGHEYIIYDGYHLDILQHSSNDEAFLNDFGEDELASVLKERGLSGLYQSLAYWAMYNDVQEYLEDAFKEYESLED